MVYVSPYQSQNNVNGCNDYRLVSTTLRIYFLLDFDGEEALRLAPMTAADSDP